MDHRVSKLVGRTTSSTVGIALMFIIGVFSIGLIVFLIGRSENNTIVHQKVINEMVSNKINEIAKVPHHHHEMMHPIKESVFISQEEADELTFIQSEVVFLMTGTLGDNLNLHNCLTAESAIASKLALEVVSVPNGALSAMLSSGSVSFAPSVATAVSDYLKKHSEDKPVLTSLGGEFGYWFTPTATDEAMSKILSKLPSDAVLVPASRKCIGSVEICSKYPKLDHPDEFHGIDPRGDGFGAKTTFQFAFGAAVFGRRKAVGAFMDQLANCKINTADCIHELYLSKRFPLIIDTKGELYVAMHDVNNKLQPLVFAEKASLSGNWEGEEGQDLRNPETMEYPKMIIFDKSMPRHVGQWRIKHFVFQPQALVKWNGQERSFLQEVCPHSVLPWLPMKKVGEARDDVRCSDVCVDSDIRCTRNEFPSKRGGMSECGTKGPYHCCSPSGWCGFTPAHCDCPLCINYRDIEFKRRLLNK